MSTIFVIFVQNAPEDGFLVLQVNTYVDFIYLQKNLIIELDGGQHLDNANHDWERTKWLQSQGFKVLCYGIMKYRNKHCPLSKLYGIH